MYSNECLTLYNILYPEKNFISNEIIKKITIKKYIYYDFYINIEKILDESIGFINNDNYIIYKDIIYIRHKKKNFTYIRHKEKYFTYTRHKEKNFTYIVPRSFHRLSVHFLRISPSIISRLFPSKSRYRLLNAISDPFLY